MFDIDRVAAKVGNSAPTVIVHDYKEIAGTKLYQVVVSHTHDAGKKENLASLNRLLAGEAQAVEGSFRRINDPAETRLVSTGFITANRIVEEFSEERAKTMKTVAKNVMMDTADESLWDLRESPSGAKYIARQAEEDISPLLAGLSTRRVGVATIATIASSDCARLHYIGFVNPQTTEMDYGYVMASDFNKVKVLPRGAQQPMVVSAQLVVESHNNFDVHGTLAQLRQLEAEGALDDEEDLHKYYDQLYSYDPEYVKKFDEIINRNATL